MKFCFGTYPAWISVIFDYSIKGQRTKLLPTAANSQHSASVDFPGVDLGSWEIKVLQGIEWASPEERGGRKRPLRDFVFIVESLYLVTLRFGRIGFQKSAKAPTWDTTNTNKKLVLSLGRDPSDFSPDPASSFSYNCLFTKRRYLLLFHRNWEHAEQ